MNTVKTTAKPSARDRLLAAADELFYAEGVQSVGIDRIIEHAGVAKATLYNNFGSKDDLIRAYLESRHGDTVAHVNDAIERYDDPRQRLLAVFEAQAEIFETPGFNGCAFASASAEAPEGGAVRTATDFYRHWVRETFTDLAAQAGAVDPPFLAAQLHLLYDGAGQAAREDKTSNPAFAARAAAVALLDNAVKAPANSAKDGSGGTTAR